MVVETATETTAIESDSSNLDYLHKLLFDENAEIIIRKEHSSRENKDIMIVKVEIPIGAETYHSGWQFESVEELLESFKRRIEIFHTCAKRTQKMCKEKKNV